MNFVYGLYESAVNSAPSAAAISQVTIVVLQPNFSETHAIPYIDIAAPTYMKALQNPLVVAAFPYFEKRPARQEIKNDKA